MDHRHLTVSDGVGWRRRPAPYLHKLPLKRLVILSPSFAVLALSRGRQGSSSGRQNCARLQSALEPVKPSRAFPDNPASFLDRRAASRETRRHRGQAVRLLAKPPPIALDDRIFLDAALYGLFGVSWVTDPMRSAFLRSA